MKTSHLILIGIIAIIATGLFVTFFQIQLTDVSPCFNKDGNHFRPCTPEESILFYEYKGQEWMEMKKQEMIKEIRNNAFDTWIDQTKDDYSHWNVYQYYSFSEDLTKYHRDLDEGLDSGWITDEDYCGEWCNQEELYKLGCTKPMLEHILRYSNLLDEEIDGPIYLEWAGLPDGITQEEFQKCFDAISEKRTPITEISDLKFKQINCEDFGGTWLSKPNECEGITKSQCSQMNAVYSEKSSCRYYPNPDDCFTGAVSVCEESSESDYNLQVSDCPEGQDYNQVLFRCVVSCKDDLVYNGYTDSCTTEFELKYHGFCNDEFTYNPLSHTCSSDNGTLQIPLKDPPRTPPPEPVPMKCKSGPAPGDEYYFDEGTCKWKKLENEN